MTFIHVSDSYKQDHKIELPCEKSQHLLLLDEEAISVLYHLCKGHAFQFRPKDIKNIGDFFQLILEEGRQPQGEEIS